MTSRFHFAAALPFAIVPFLMLAGCSDGNDRRGTDGDGGSALTSSPTFHRDVVPILQKSCRGCHSPDNIAPFSLIQYEDARTVAQAIASSARARTMPPFHAQMTDECQPPFGWKDDISLSEEQIQTLEAWSKAGAPEGDPKDAPPPSAAPRYGLQGVNLEVQWKSEYEMSGDKDEFHCFFIDLGLTEDKYLTGLQFVPGNKEVVHHAFVNLDPRRSTEVNAGPDGSYACPAGNLIDGNGQLITPWAPGSDPVNLPEGVAMFVPKGSGLAVQVHYHPAGRTAVDRSLVQLRLTSEKPRYGFIYSLMGNFTGPVDATGSGLLPGPDDTAGVEFLIPANSKSHVETEQFTVLPYDESVPYFLRFPEGSRIYSVMPHMHYLGYDEKVTITRADSAGGEPKEECLVHAPGWKFDWQRAYAYDASVESLPTLAPGNAVKMRCTYDNTMENPFLARALMDAHIGSPTDVTYGEGATLDEMCVALIGAVFPLP